MYKTISLEDLMNVSDHVCIQKTAKTNCDAASAIYVVTQEDSIRRSGATNIPDALRRVPGIQVAHISAYEYHGHCITASRWP